MATIIRPKSGDTWDKVFPHAYADSEGETIDGDEGRALITRLGRYPMWYTLSNVLYVLAAFLSRGTVKIKASERTRVWVLNKLVTSFVNDSYGSRIEDYDSDKQMAALGRNVYWLVKVLDTEPGAWRESGFARGVSITVGDAQN